MMDWPDIAALRAAQQGTQQSEVVTSDDWANQAPPAFNNPLNSDKVADHNQFEWYIYTLAAGASMSKLFLIAPDVIFICTDDTANVRLRVYMGGGQGGPYFPLGRAGNVKFYNPGNVDFTIANTGSASSTFIIVAMSKAVAAVFSYDFGNFA